MECAMQFFHTDDVGKTVNKETQAVDYGSLTEKLLHVTRF